MNFLEAMMLASMEAERLLQGEVALSGCHVDHGYHVKIECHDCGWHEHKCRDPKCGHVWAHDARLVTPGFNYDADHLCPKCGRDQRMKLDRTLLRGKAQEAIARAMWA